MVVSVLGSKQEKGRTRLSPTENVPQPFFPIPHISRSRATLGSSATQMPAVGEKIKNPRATRFVVEKIIITGRDPAAAGRCPRPRPADGTLANRDDEKLETTKQ